MKINGKEIGFEDLVKIYSDKCEYCEDLEERLIEQNKKNDNLQNQIDVMSRKVKRIKDKYDELYKFAEKLTTLIDERDEDIKTLIELNNELRKVNEQMQCSTNSSIRLTRKIIEII